MVNVEENAFNERNKFAELPVFVGIFYDLANLFAY